MGQYGSVPSERSHPAGPGRHRARLTLLCGAALALFEPSSLRAQALADAPDAGVATDAGGAPAPVAPATAVVASAPATAVGSPLAAAVGVRSLLFAQNPAARDKLDDVGATGEVNVVLWGQVHPFLKWQAGFIGTLGDSADTGAAVLDLLAELELADPFHLWIGRMPVPSDRTSLSTAWAIAPFTLPGRYQTFAPIAPAGSRSEAGPRRGALDRDDGVTLWGQLGGGRFKYYVGAFDLTRPASSPLYSARLALSLLDPEPGFRTSSSYFGAKKVLAFGLGAQHRAQGSLPAQGSTTALPDDFDELNGDLLFETGNESAGILDLELAIAKLWGRNEIASYQYFALVSYLLPLDVGIGRFQPLFRLQHAEHGSAEDASDFTCIDAQLGYIIDGHHARVSTGYQYARVNGQAQNAVLFGVQLVSKGK
jgi:hypothetical protein